MILDVFFFRFFFWLIALIDLKNSEVALNSPDIAQLVMITILYVYVPGIHSLTLC